MVVKKKEKEEIWRKHRMNFGGGFLGENARDWIVRDIKSNFGGDDQ